MGFKKCVLTFGLSVITAHVFGQMPGNGVHYPAGLNGIKAGIPDAPGIYLRDDNLIYTTGDDQSADFNNLVYLQAPQLMWLSGWKILGAHFGADVMVPLIYKEWELKGPTFILPGGQRIPGRTETRHQFGLGDVKLEPLLLAWHWQHCDLMAAATVWAPTGYFSVGSMNNLGDGEWSPMLSLGAVWYPDEKKTWALSILHHYEFNSTQIGSFGGNPIPGGGFSLFGFKKISCSTYTLECAASKTIFEHTDVGLAGYYQQQFSDDSVAVKPAKNSAVAGAGPEISVLIPQWGLSASLRFAYEFVAYDHPRGETIDLSVTKKF